MKKILTVAFILSLFITQAQAIENANNTDKTKCIKAKQCAEAGAKMNKEEFCKQKEMEFEKKLGLTEEQIAKARDLRKVGHEKIRPIIEEIIAKKQEVEMVKKSRIAVQAQEEKLAVLDAEILELEKKAHEIRKSNMKDFESILTKEQKKILNDMKKEKRKKMQKGCKCKKSCKCKK